METLSTTQANTFATRYPAMVDRLYRQLPGVTIQAQGIEAAICNHFAAMSAVNHTFKRETFYRLLMLMYGKKCYGVLKNPAFIEVLANVSTFGNKTVRPPEEWVNDSLTPEGQLASLIRHLFAKYEVPAFMEYVFAEGSKVHMLWYIQLGRGESVKQLCAFPATFTNAMAHAFRNTPYKTYTIDQAIRRAQAIGFGAGAQMAEVIAWAVNVALIRNWRMREKVIRFVVKNAGDASFADVQLALEYIAEMYSGDKNYSLKGRTWVSVHKAATDFMEEHAKRVAASMAGDWPAASVGDYKKTEGGIVYRIIQLVTATALYDEGNEMSHCVASYDTDCANGDVAIFSLRKFTDGESGYKTLATLEVALLTKELTEAKAKYNDMVSAEAEEHIKAWVREQNLVLDSEFFYSYEPVEGVPLQYMGGEPVPHQEAEMPIIVPRPDPLEEHRRMMAERRHAAPELDVKMLIYIILIVIRILMFLAR